SQPLPVLLAGGGIALAVSRLGGAKDRGLLLPLWAVAMPMSMSALSAGHDLLTGNFGRYFHPLFPAWILLGILALEPVGLAAVRAISVGRLRLPLGVPLAVLLFFIPMASRLQTAGAVYLQSRRNVE